MQEFSSIQLNKSSGIPVYKQLGDAFYQLIEQGVLKAHRKLPPIRKMSTSLRINNDTVINAYKYLESLGAVYSIVGSGTYVAPITQNTEYCNNPCFKISAYEQHKRMDPLRY